MRRGSIAVVVLLASILTGCGGGGGGGGAGGSAAGSTVVADGSSSSAASGSTDAFTSASSSVASVAGASVNPQQAARFLIQATFGPSQASVDALTQINIETWIEREFTRPQDRLHADHVGAYTFANRTIPLFWESFWKGAISGEDQLRQRMAFALSEIFVVSFESDLSNSIRAVASYYDMLGRDAFGNFRTLLEDVSLHPAMGIYLSHVHNQKEDGRGRMPDENYAREVMQLFSIGLYQLNLDGTPKLAGGKPIETYTNDDITGLAKVFTGFSWSGPDKSNARFIGTSVIDASRDITSMQGYPQYHSTSAKSFLGVTIPPQNPANPEASLKIALDTVFNHPNVGPFIGKQLIQRLVTSNPSPAYVARVASAFNNNGSGVRGDMKAVIRAILLDEEARNASLAQGATYGKLREPVVRLANWARAFGAASTSGRFAIGDTGSTTAALAQAPIKSPSVFNFFRPGYMPANGQAAAYGLVVPEMQISHETSMPAYLNFMQEVVQSGPASSTGSQNDRIVANYPNELALADTPTALVDRVNLLLLANGMKSAARTQIIDAVTSIAIPSSNATAAATARKNRVYLAVFLAMASPEYIVQK